MPKNSLAIATLMLMAGMLMGLAEGQEPPKMAANAALAVAPGASLKLEGTSTLHPWSATTKEVRATFRVKAGAAAGDPASLARSGAVEGFELSIPVASLKSGEGGLDDNMYKALLAAKNPIIVFRMSSYAVAPAAAAGPFKAALKGTLSLAGATREVTLDLEAQPSARGLRVTGSKVLSMKDFGVKAPVLMLGMIKTGDAVNVRFDLDLVAPTATKPAVASNSHG